MLAVNDWAVGSHCCESLLQFGEVCWGDKVDFVEHQQVSRGNLVLKGAFELNALMELFGVIA